MPLAERRRHLLAVDWVSGVFMLFSSQTYAEVGGFDARYFLYYEDADLCARARAAGWKIAWDSDGRMWHKVSQSTGTDSPLTVYYMRRNVLRYLASLEAGFAG